MLTLLHTAAVHVDTFTALRDQIAPNAELTHLVHPELLAEAQDGITPELEQRIETLVSGAVPMICTCTTIGEVAARYGATRIDQPMMRQAVGMGRVLMAFALESTRAPSRDLFLAESGQEEDLTLLDLSEHWPLFEAGDTAAFHAAIAQTITAVHDGFDVIVLAQASMAGAAKMLALPIPVLSSPELALRDGLGLQAGTTG